MAEITNSADFQVFSRFCSPALGLPYWLFRVRRGDVYRRYVLPFYLPMSPTGRSSVEARWNDLEGLEPLLSIAQKRPILY